MHDAALPLELGEERRTGIRRQDMERRALEPVRLDPLDGLLEYLRPVVIEAEHEAPVYLNAVVVQDLHAARVVFRDRRALARVGEVVELERLEADEDARAPGQRHVADQGRIVRNVDRDRGAPDDAERRRGTPARAS